MNDGSNQKDFNTFVELKVTEINNLKSIKVQIVILEVKANVVHEEVDEYVKSLSSKEIENNLDLLETLIDNLDAIDEKVNAENEAKNGHNCHVMASYGDILYYGIGNSNAVGEKSFTGHNCRINNNKLLCR